MEPQKTKREITRELLVMIRHHGRALSENEGECAYRIKNHPGCAVGRCIIPEKYNEDMEGTSVKVHSSGVGYIKKYKLEDILIPAYRGHSGWFWQQLQNLHDRNEYWMDKNGQTVLNVKGQQYLHKIQKEFNFQL